MFQQLHEQMMQQSLKYRNLHETKYPPTNLYPTPSCQMQNCLTTSDTTCNTHPDILPIHGQTTALLPIYDPITNRCSYTYRNIARTPIEVSGARRMTRQHSHLGPVFFQCPRLASSSQKNQQQFNLYQSLRIC